MPRRNEKARDHYIPRELKQSKFIKPHREPAAVIVPINKNTIEHMSPGRVVAIAEWR